MMQVMTRALILVAMVGIGASAAVAEVSDSQLDTARKIISEKFPRIQPENVNRSKVPGLLEIQQGVLVAYVSEDGRYLLQGEILDLTNDSNLTEESAAVGRLELMSALAPDAGIVFAPENPTHTITVFTDIDCTFCRKLHSEIESYNNAGIAVRYLMYPRSGPNTRSWEKAEEVWCANDRLTALTKAKNDQSLPQANCDAGMIDEHFQLGLSIGLSGTPAIVAEDGMLVSGYLPAEELAVRLGLVQPATAARSR